ncbi:cytosolic endo-beta-N-acetylglucosaminidase isoform X2 [Cylas formicarius]|uniref:cytosolic endo-beta-N-acetylglucosaminidase isoform X2 n=1 Tax=Cylas formicarius TaxID=197179 RepID=UPI002958BA1F|nr:cytosolic endo-beta-N-acetylglucosaminidase isoform X2 [Cylas formicarius]
MVQILKIGGSIDAKQDKMVPSLFMQCHPITNAKEIKDVIFEPPSWVDRVETLKKRSATVVKNVLSDCHSDSKHFIVRNRLDSKTVPQTLVCHDYKGGYLEDRFIYFENESIQGDGYTFYNWAQIDYFVYFSHHFVTIPPLAWINAGHRNGVKVLGTLITEFKEGTKICDEDIFESIPSMMDFAQDLVDLTRIFGFDGWLLNIENEVKNPKILQEFVKLFTELIHNDNEENVVIWYDSVTEDGKLQWQDELNERNRCFFDRCDGIFLNYSWNEQKLINTVENAAHRNFNVFVGIDVFGRNMFGGGKFNTFKAVEMVTRYNLSIALFAPGWTHETIDRSASGTIFDDFLTRDYAFWCSLWPYLYTHPINDYFETDFYIGLDRAYYNLFRQRQQPSRFLYPQNSNLVADIASIPTLINTCSCMQQKALNSRNGCFLSKENLKLNTEFVHHLFVCELEIRGTNLTYFLTKSLTDGPSEMSVTLLTRSKSGAFRKIKLLADFKEGTTDDQSLLEVNPKRTSLHNDNEVRVIHNKFDSLKEGDFHLSLYEFYTPPCTILEIGATIEAGNSIHLCGFGIKRLLSSS